MEEESNILETQLISAIAENLQNHLVANAVFLAERLLAERDCEETRNILAECYLSEQKPFKAYEILKDCKSDSNRYLFALTCFKMGNMREAERALLLQSDINSIRHLLANNRVDSNIPNGSYGLYLLAQIYERNQKHAEAKEYYAQALELNPSLWIAYEKLCRLGEQVLPNKVFNEVKYRNYENIRKPNPTSFLSSVQTRKSSMKGEGLLMSGSKKTNEDLQMEQEIQEPSLGTINTQPATKASKGAGGSIHSLKAAMISTNSQNVINSFSVNFEESSNPNPSSLRHTKASPPQHHQVYSHGPQVPSYTINLSPNPSGVPISSYNKSAKKESSKLQITQPQSLGHGQVGYSSHGPGGMSNLHNPNKMNQESRTQQGGGHVVIKDLMTLLMRLGEAYSHMSIYMTTEAIEYFSKLPPKHYHTGWVLTNIGKCYMECTKYSEAEKYFSESFKLEPYRLEGLEYYSTCLWHLKKNVELCYLAHSALGKSLLAPETWIAVGNCFSLQKEHENALKFFSRAIQLNPHFSYAHCLCGHEYVYNEDWQKAKKCFDMALTWDFRNYSAWWGLGNIFFKQEKFDKAAENFQRAISINPKNPVLYSYLGMTLACKDNLEEALANFENSEVLDKNNVLNKFQKANVQVRLGQYDTALKELENLRRSMPRESPIPVLIGKIYKKLGQIDKAHQYFTIALDLENKESQKIKGLIESLHTQNEFNEDFDI